MINELTDKLREKIKELKELGISENTILKVVTDLLTEELKKMPVDERNRFFVAFERDKKLKQILDEE